MGFSYNRKLLSLALLGIILPMGLLTTFKLTGILKESPTITETTTLDVVRWSSEQIFCLINIGDMVKSQYDNGEISIVHSMDIYDYNDENWGGYFGSATLSTSVNLTATVKNGFVSKVYVSFREDYENSTVGLRLEKSLIKLENLSLINYGHWLDGNVKAFFDASNANSSSSVYLRLPAYWLLGRINKVNQTRLLEVTYEVTYFNGTTYKKIVQPFHLVMYPEDNDSFDTADAVTPGDYGMDSLLCLGGYDTQDFYKIYLGNGFIIDIKAYPSGIQDFDLYLYNPNGVQKAKSETRGNAMESINYEVDSAGWWFIETRLVVGIGFYNMSISTEYIGRCPTLFVWNGTDYAYEALLDIHAESDITLQHRITQPLVKDGIFYKLSLRELDEFTSHIDQVRLYAVDSHGEWHICPLVSAIHSEQGWVTLQLRFDDNTRVDLTPTQTINLKFTYLKDDIAYFTFEINGHNRKIP